MNDSALQAAPVEEVLAGLRIPPLPAGTSPAGLLAFVKLHEADGGTGWSVRVTAELDDEEVLGLLTGYVEHLRQVAAASWDDGDPTRADDWPRRRTDARSCRRSDDPARGAATKLRVGGQYGPEGRLLNHMTVSGSGAPCGSSTANRR